MRWDYGTELKKPVEYEFTLADGSKVFEIVCNTGDINVFARGHKATAYKPVAL